MSSLQIGQKVEVDVFGLRLPGFGADAMQATGTIVDMGPGTITVRIERNGQASPEVTVSPGRLRF